MNRRTLPIVCLLLLSWTVIPAQAGTIITMTLSGIGSNMGLTNFSFGVSGNFVNGSGGWQVHNPKSTDFSITRNYDSFSTDLQTASVLLKQIKSGEIDFFKSGYSSTLPYLEYQFSDGYVTGYHLLNNSGGGSGIPQESFSFTFEKLTIHYAANDHNPWGAVLPPSNQVLEGPFSLSFLYDLAFDASQFGNSDIFMDATIPGQVPEPASLALLGSGVAGLLGLRRRMR